MALILHILSASGPEAPYLELTVAYWLDVPAALQARFADPTATSRVPWATAAEVQALRAGQVVEVVETVRWADPPPVAETIDLLKRRARTVWREAAAARGVAVPDGPAFWRAGLRYDGGTDSWSVVATGTG